MPNPTLSKAYYERNNRFMSHPPMKVRELSGFLLNENPVVFFPLSLLSLLKGSHRVLMSFDFLDTFRVLCFNET